MVPPRIRSFAISPKRFGVLFPTSVTASPCTRCCAQFLRKPLPSPTRTFSTSSARTFNWLEPNRTLTFKDPTGRPRLATGGSVRGTTVVWGDYGLRMRDHDRRISAKQLKIGEEVIRRRMKGSAFRLYTRVHAGTAVFTKGNESRMGTGKGAFDYWACRVSVNRVVFEIKSNAHEQVIRDAFRLAGNKLPGLWEFVKKGDPPIMGLTKLGGDVTPESLKRPRVRRELSGVDTAHRLPGTPSPS